MSNASTNPNVASSALKFKVGMFVVFALAFVGILTVYINNRPFWWRACEPVQVTVEDATGLKMKSPVKSLGLDIGYISKIALVSEGVTIQICITAPVEVQSETKAYVRGEGFLGDRFLELKPVRYTGKNSLSPQNTPFSPTPAQPEKSSAPATSSSDTKRGFEVKPVSLFRVLDFLVGVNESRAQNQDRKQIPVAEKSADMQQVMSEVNGLMKEVKDMTTNLNSAINPEEIRGTIKQLNKTLEDASKALSPQGGLTATAQRSLIKLEDAIEQMRDQMTKINQGQGSVGMVLNDPAYAEELKKALQNLNRLLNRASDLRLNILLGISQLSGYQATRSSFELKIWPRPDRFYRIGVSADPRGSISQTTTTTIANGTTNTVQNTLVSQGGYSFTAMIGKRLFPRADISVGILHGDGAAALNLNLWHGDDLELLQLIGEVYFRAQTVDGRWTARPDGRTYLFFQPISIFFLEGGIEGFRRVNGELSAFYGAGIRFDDEDIRLLFSFL